jgi:hypothetical protein
MKKNLSENVVEEELKCKDFSYTVKGPFSSERLQKTAKSVVVKGPLISNLPLAFTNPYGDGSCN